MGLFDTLSITCPHCGEGQIEFQSKAGECLLDVYDLSNVPDVIAADLIGKNNTCKECGYKLRLYGKVDLRYF